VVLVGSLYFPKSLIQSSIRRHLYNLRVRETFRCLVQTFGRLVVQGIFLGTKYRIKYFLEKVYLNPDYVDASLVKSIFNPACDPMAPAVRHTLNKSKKRFRFCFRLYSVPRVVRVLRLYYDPRRTARQPRRCGAPTATNPKVYAEHHAARAAACRGYHVGSLEELQYVLCYE
jgi:hypothetical protein